MFFIIFSMLCISFCEDTLAATGYNIFKDKGTYYSGSNDKLRRVGYYTGKGVMGQYPTRKGAILITCTGSIANLVGHAAIVYSSSSVIEALSKGVCIGRNNWNISKRNVAAVTVRDTSCREDRLVAGWCKSRIGKKYNYDYFNTSTRSKYYCSQLIWAGYKDKYGINLNTKKYDTFLRKAVGPLEFIRKNTSDTFIIYMKNWTR